MQRANWRICAGPLVPLFANRDETAATLQFPSLGLRGTIAAPGRLDLNSGSSERRPLAALTVSLPQRG
jgi:hypothetical protein